MRTKAADEHELKRKLKEHYCATAAAAAAATEPMEEDDDWEVSYHRKAMGENSSIDPCHPARTSSGVPALVKSTSDGLMMSNSSSEEYPKDDDCVFTLEL